jgi:hypothetical protein
LTTRLAAGAAAAALLVLGAGGARAYAQPSIADEAGEPPPGHYHSPENFAFELRFGPFRPDIDSEFNGARTPYRDFYGPNRSLLSQIEFDWEFLHYFGVVAAGIGVGYFQNSANAPFVNPAGAPSGDQSTIRVVPISLSAIYRFDYFLENNNIPLVPFAKLGLDWSYWRITDGNGEVATDGQGGTGSGGTLGWHVAGGFALVLDMFDPEAARDFDADLGVNHTALVFQWTFSDVSGLGQSGRLHVGDDIWSAGLLMQF